MKFNLIQKEVESLSIADAHVSPSINVSGCDSLAFVMVATDSATPDTATIQLFGSLDDITYVAIGSPTAVADDGAFPLIQDRPPYLWYQVQYAIADGSYTATLKVLAKGDLD